MRSYRSAKRARFTVSRARPVSPAVRTWTTLARCPHPHSRHHMKQLILCDAKPERRADALEFVDKDVARFAGTPEPHVVKSIGPTGVRRIRCLPDRSARLNRAPGNISSGRPPRAGRHMVDGCQRASVERASGLCGSQATVVASRSQIDTQSYASISHQYDPREDDRRHDDAPHVHPSGGHL